MFMAVVWYLFVYCMVCDMYEVESRVSLLWCHRLVRLQNIKVVYVVRVSCSCGPFFTALACYWCTVIAAPVRSCKVLEPPHYIPGLRCFAPPACDVFSCRPGRLFRVRHLAASGLPKPPTASPFPDDRWGTREDEPQLVQLR